MHTASQDIQTVKEDKSNGPAAVGASLTEPTAAEDDAAAADAPFTDGVYAGDGGESLSYDQQDPAANQEAYDLTNYGGHLGYDSTGQQAYYSYGGMEEAALLYEQGSLHGAYAPVHQQAPLIFTGNISTHLVFPGNSWP